MHVRFETKVPHGSESTRFLALDKCLPDRPFMEILDLPTTTPVLDEELKVMFDFEWLAILRATHHLASSSAFPTRMPGDKLPILDSDIKRLQRRASEFLTEKQIVNKVPGEWLTDFVKTVPSLNDPEEVEWRVKVNMGNPQTDLLLEFLELDHAFTTPFRIN